MTDKNILKTYVIGNKTKKSLSPHIFNYWFKQNKIKGYYSCKEINQKMFNNKIKHLLSEQKTFGFNVTIPFKELIKKKLDKIDSHSKKIGAVNQVTKNNNKWVGKNTDWIGFIKAVKKKTTLKNKKKAFVFGYGGASKAIIYALKKEGFKKIYIYNRSDRKLLGINKKRIFEKVSKNNIIKKIKKSDIVINTTPVDVLAQIVPNNKKLDIFAFDVVYKPKETSFLSHFKKQKRIYGIHMLVYQAEPCFKDWYGIMPKTDNKLFRYLENFIKK